MADRASISRQPISSVTGLDSRILGTELFEAYVAARSTVVATPATMVARTVRYDTTSSAISQPLPLASSGAAVGLGWDAGANALTFTAASRIDTCGTTSGSATVTDASITAADFGRLVTGPGIPAGSYVGTVTAGASFLLSSSSWQQVNATATATAAAASLTISDMIGPGTATSLVVPLIDEVIALRCTVTGRWRIVAGHKSQTSLDARYAALAHAHVIADVTGLQAALDAKAAATVAVNAQSASYTLVAADQGRAVHETGASASTVTVPTNASVAFPVGAVALVAQMGAGQVTLAGASGVTLRTASSLTTRAQYSEVSVRKIGADEWLVAGDLT